MGGACSNPVAQEPEGESEKMRGIEQAYADPEAGVQPAAAAEPSERADGTRHDVRISYAHKDADHMRKLRERLVAEGLSVWVDDEVRAAPNPHRCAALRP